MAHVLRVIKSFTVTDATLAASSVPEADHATWLVGTTYALAARVILNHKIYESLQAGNVGKAPATEADWWSEVSPTNRWKCLDLSSTSQTQTDTADYYEITPGQAVNAVALINISGLTSVRVRLTDAYFGVVYDTGVLDLASVPSESSWYAWFFDVRTEQTQLVFDNLPSYHSATLRVDVTSSPNGLIGALVLGAARNIGLGVNAGARVGIQDFSRKERTAYGDTVLVQRAYSKKLSISTQLSNDDLDNTYKLLADIRATPCLWIAHGTWGVLSVFGFYQDFDISIQYAKFADCTLTIEGLT